MADYDADVVSGGNVSGATNDDKDAFVATVGTK